MSTASCVSESEYAVQQVVKALLPERKIKGSLDYIAGKTAVSYWKLRKLWNPSLQQYGFALEADEHRAIKQFYDEHLDAQEGELLSRLDNIRRAREQRNAGHGGAHA